MNPTKQRGRISPIGEEGYGIAKRDLTWHGVPLGDDASLALGVWGFGGLFVVVLAFALWAGWVGPCEWYDATPAKDIPARCLRHFGAP